MFRLDTRKSTTAPRFGGSRDFNAMPGPGLMKVISEKSEMDNMSFVTAKEHLNTVKASKFVDVS